MWGTLREWHGEPHRERFIPTHVGNTIQAEAINNRERFIPTHVGNT